MVSKTIALIPPILTLSFAISFICEIASNVFVEDVDSSKVTKNKSVLS